MSANSSPYDILEVPEGATTAEIKAAYRKLALKWHPDKNRGNAAAEEKFKQVNHAYEILSDPEKKREFDSGRDPQSYDAPGNYFKKSRRHTAFDDEFSTSHAFDIFNSFFQEMNDFGFGNSMFSDDFMGAPLRRTQSRRANDPFGSSFGGFESMFGAGGATGFTSSSTNISFGGGGGSYSSSSTSTTTEISADGTRTTKKITTIRHPDGREERKVEQSVTDRHGKPVMLETGLKPAALPAASTRTASGRSRDDAISVSSSDGGSSVSSKLDRRGGTPTSSCASRQLPHSRPQFH